ncbi:unnamed protein product [Rotaria sp. Silwood1]|nr:unnamed protein product [Rotaria sp. Silwood1]CAF1007795.1 unnamed protein product [Rotaria sp. Silwood1]CAF1016550.1 unnamed protein product [Rotaria sp. Silwood1]CAF3388272.1 unnamed protein product [Rotaria sp. Silwood1]CAF3412740.1 unnamed protein product [Rotaria sp. Silwood1]
MNNNNDNKNNNILIANQWQLERKLGSGSFGDVYRALNIQTGEYVAIKLETNNAYSQQLVFEAKLYKLMKDIQGIPKLYWFGEEGNYKCLVMELLGPSLEDLFYLCKREFSLKTILIIKPDNFLIGIGKDSTKIFLIDFGLAKKFFDHRLNKHISYKEGKSLTGTPRYVSISTHLGIEQSRRDDMEALAYVLIYFSRGTLPWQGIKALNKRQKYEKICELKMSISITNLCAGFSPEFAMYLNYCRRLKYTDEPDYFYIRQIFRNLSYRLNYQYDYIFDWIELKNQISSHCLNQNQQQLEKNSIISNNNKLI